MRQFVTGGFDEPLRLKSILSIERARTATKTATKAASDPYQSIY